MTRSLNRFLSITFDDGFRYAAEVACEALHPLGIPATFYVVTGWVEPARASITEPYNEGRSHGDWNLWRQVRDAGHEVGSHTFSHVNAGGKKSIVLPWLVRNQVERSYQDLVREVPQARYTISMPWNAATTTSERHVRRYFAGCRLGSKLAYNRLGSLESFRLLSWAPSPATNDAEFRQAIARIPDNGWLILQFHSFDDEGWDPISRKRFKWLCETIAATEGVSVRTVGDVVSRFATFSPQDGRSD
jgi:peptidoglycan/xylan/chitin deacetylase (PgdA/CDA1 family)